MRLAISLAEGSLGNARKLTALENQSMTMGMVVLPLDGGRSVSSGRHGTRDDGTGRGRKRLEQGLGDVLVQAQTKQAA